MLVIHCAKHNRIALCRTDLFCDGGGGGGSETSETEGSSKTANTAIQYKELYKFFRWFPYSFTMTKMTWQQIVMSAICMVLGLKTLSEDQMSTLINSINIMNMLHWQLPHLETFVNRVVYYVAINDKVHDPCGRPVVAVNGGKCLIEWFPIKDAIQGRIDNVWGAEVAKFAQQVYKNRQVICRVEEYGLKDVYFLLPSRVPSPAQMTEEQYMLYQCKITQQNMEMIYDDFIQHCYPMLAMNVVSFKCYMVKHRIESNPERLEQYYRAFRYRDDVYMSFHELFIGLVAINKHTKHCSTRLNIIFRFDHQDFVHY